MAHRTCDAPLLVQVCLESEGNQTGARELRAIEAEIMLGEVTGTQAG